jgi:hypothetical protein
MRKYYLGDDAKNNKTDDEAEGKFPLTLQSISEFVQDGGLFADFEDKREYVIVKVRAYTGTSEYLARGPGTLMWLAQKSYKRESRGVVTNYYIKYDSAQPK